MRNVQDHKDPGKNVNSNDPSKRGTERADGKKVQGAWGKLPDYVLKQGRGSMPDVPLKYRKYMKAMQEADQKKEAKKKKK